MIVHIEEFVGDDAPLWLPLARSELRKWDEFYAKGEARTKTLLVPGGQIRLRQIGDLQYIAINVGGAPYFEFHTSAFPVITEDGTQGPVSFTKYNGAVVGTTLRTSKTDAGVEELNLDPIIRGSKRTTDGGRTQSIVGRQSQVQLINEPMACPFPLKSKDRERRFPTSLYESWAPGHARTGPIAMRAATFQSGYLFMPDPGNWDTYTDRDRGYDVPVEVGNRLAKNQLAYIGPPSDWPRAAGLQRVTSEQFGKRTFAINVDASGAFAVFPLGSIEAENGIEQNVSEGAVQRLPFAYPGWAYVPSQPLSSSDAEQSLVDQPEIDWQFSHDGTKAVAIVHQRRPFTNDPTYWAANASTTPLTQGVFDWMIQGFGYQGRQFASYQPGYNPTAYFYAPGVVEVTISIEVTGADLKDFSASITLREVRTPETMTRWAMVVGYVWHDVYADDGVTIRVAAGDMVAIDLERWAGSDSGGRLSYANALIMSIRKVATNEELYCSPLATRPDTAQPLVAVDLKTLSFVQRRRPSISDTTLYPYIKRSDGTAQTTTHYHGNFALAVFVGLKFKELLTRESDYPPGAIDDLRTRIQTENVRAAIDGLVAARVSWSTPFQYVYPNTPFDDGWDDETLRYIRHQWAYERSIPFQYYDGTNPLPVASRGYNVKPGDQYKVNSAVSAGLTAPNYSQRIEQLYALWHGVHDQIVNLFDYIPDSLHLLVCAAPKWGWNAYMSGVQDAFYLSPWLTFYAHPTGSWALWSNGYIYNGEGWPDGGETVGSPNNANTLQFATVDQFEHIIFDRIHLELKGATVTKDTTFLELYNTAVAKLEDKGDLKPMTRADMRGTFTKGEITLPNGAKIMEVVMSFGGKTWYFPARDYNEAPPGQIAGGPYALATVLSLHQLWFTGPNYTGQTRAPIDSIYHPRFANPTLLIP